MKQKRTKNVTKQITCIIIILMLCNFIIPNVIIPTTVQATEDLGIFDENITFSSEYIKGNGDIMPHGVITPSTASSSQSVPLIVWLHGDGEFGGGESTCMGDGNRNLFPRVLRDSDLEKFNAYILIPHSTGRWKTTKSDGTPTWQNSEAIKNVSTLIEDFVNEKKNVDTNNIIIAGHSRGGMGAQYMVINMDKMPYKFSKLVVLSGYGVGGIDSIKIPTRGYVGSAGDSAYSYMTGTFASNFENIKVTSGHAAVPRIVYNLDKDNNGRSDLIEWMFNDYKVNIPTGDINVDSEMYVNNIDGGGDLLNGIAGLFCIIPDVVIGYMQDMFTSHESIQTTDGAYQIKYSPGIIFSGTVPALDINFINPNRESIIRTKGYDTYVKEFLIANFENAKLQKNTDTTDFEEAKNKANVQSVELRVRLDSSNNIREGSDYVNGGTLSTERMFNAYYWVENDELFIKCEYHINNPNNMSGGAANSRIRRISLL